MVPAFVEHRSSVLASQRVLDLIVNQQFEGTHERNTKEQSHSTF